MDKKEISNQCNALVSAYKQWTRDTMHCIDTDKYKDAISLINQGESIGEAKTLVNKVMNDCVFSAVPRILRFIEQMMNVTEHLMRNFNIIIGDHKKCMDNLDIARKLYKNSNIPEDGDTSGTSDALMSRLLFEPSRILVACDDSMTALLHEISRREKNKQTMEESAEETTIFDSVFTEGFEDSLFLSTTGNEIFTEAGLSESFIFGKLNDTSSITDRLTKIIKTGSFVTKEFIEDQYNQINKIRLSPISDRVLQAFDSGQIKLVYNSNLHLTIALPFMVTKIGGKFCAIICIGDFCSTTKDGSSLNIEMKKLYTLMEAAYIALHYYTRTNVFNRSSTVAKLTASIYSEMILRILNKEFALSLEKESYDMINYSIARFYLEKILELPDGDVIHSYARGCCKSPDNATMEMIRGMYDTHSPKNIEELLKFFTELYPKMERMNFRYFFERWISSYAIGATLAIDNFPYLYYAILSVLLGSFMVNNTALNDLVKNTTGMKHFHGEISRLV